MWILFQRIHVETRRKSFAHPAAHWHLWKRRELILECKFLFTSPLNSKHSSDGSTHVYDYIGATATQFYNK